MAIRTKITALSDDELTLLLELANEATTRRYHNATDYGEDARATADYEAASKLVRKIGGR